MTGYRKRIIRKMSALIGSIFVAGTALATSTYAWFAINHTVSATGMSISAYDDSEPYSIELYYYNGNFDGDLNYANPTNNPHGYLGYPSITGTFADNFTRASGNNEHQTSSAALYPARKLTYAAIISSNGGARSATLAVEDFLSPSGNSYTIDENVEKPILLSYAIDVHCDYCPRANVDSKLADYMSHDYFATLNHAGQSYGGAALDKFAVNSSDPGAQVLASNLEIDAQGTIIFFTVIFSDDASTYYSFVENDGLKNYYEKDSGGDSNCYMSLSFQLTDLVVY
ncbi:MAG: hypothetical protein J6328_06260 [Bacilli bacterium]|nr:hypothetical protein [Bacilli bacterium]